MEDFWENVLIMFGLIFGLLFGLIIARLVHLYGRSAFEANEYGGDFIPPFIKNYFYRIILPPWER